MGKKIKGIVTMKTTKRFCRVVVLIMAVMMVLSFTSCNKKGKNPLKGHEYQCKQESEGYWETVTLHFLEEKVVNIIEDSNGYSNQAEGSYTITPETLTGTIYSGGQEASFSYKEDGSSVSLLGMDFKKIK